MPASQGQRQGKGGENKTALFLSSSYFPFSTLLFFNSDFFFPPIDCRLSFFSVSFFSLSIVVSMASHYFFLLNVFFMVVYEHTSLVCPSIPSFRANSSLFLFYIAMGCVCDAAVCSYLYFVYGYKLSILPSFLPTCDVRCDGWVHFHTSIWVTICQERVRVAWPISFLFMNMVAHFQLIHPQKQKNHS